MRKFFVAFSEKRSFYVLFGNLSLIFQYVHIRVDMVGTNHDEVLTLWRHMPMGQFRLNISLIRLTSTYVLLGLGSFQISEF
jgi:hypothetical protein